MKKFTKIIKIPSQEIGMTVEADSKEEADELFAVMLESKSIEFTKDEEE
jgi:hypothetical protein